MVYLSNSQAIEPDDIVYVKVDPEHPTESFDEKLWNYERKAEGEKPTMIAIKAKDVNVGEGIYNLDGDYIADRIS